MPIDLVGLDFLAFGHRHQRAIALTFLGIRVNGFFAINGKPTRVGQYLAFGLELMARHFGKSRGDQILGRREEHGHEATHHEVIQLLLGFR